MWNELFGCRVCKEKDKRIADLESELSTVRTEKNRLLDEILKPRVIQVPENNEPETEPIPSKPRTWAQRRRFLEEQDRERAAQMRAEAEARRQMEALINEAAEDTLKEKVKEDAGN